MGSLYAQTPDTVGLSEVPAYTEHWYTSTAQMSTTYHTTSYMSGSSGCPFQPTTQPPELLHHSD
eukprot:4802968-Prorocentrum_lima.AAC.1